MQSLSPWPGSHNYLPPPLSLPPGSRSSLPHNPPLPALLHAVQPWPRKYEVSVRLTQNTTLHKGKGVETSGVGGEGRGMKVNCEK